jgi:predicted aldo/keto reductase-like oxidoreductase
LSIYIRMRVNSFYFNMDSKEMLTDLNSQAENLRKDLIDLEQLFNMKKEQYLKVQGAVEALTALEEPLDKPLPDAL